HRLSVPTLPTVVTLSSTLIRHPPRSPLFPYTTLFRSRRASDLIHRSTSRSRCTADLCTCGSSFQIRTASAMAPDPLAGPPPPPRSEEHTSELQSRENLVCRLLLEKKKTHKNKPRLPHA